MDEAILHFIKRQLESILSLVDLEKDGTVVDIDGFSVRDARRPPATARYAASHGLDSDTSSALSRHPAQVSGSSYQDIRNAAIYEPRIELIRNELEGLLEVVDVETEGEAVQVDGFRLRNLRDWLSPSPCDPSEVFGYAGARCNCDCVFCCNKGNAPSVALGNLRRPPQEEFEEMKTRLDYFLPKPGRCLFPSLGDIYEVMVHPHFLEVLRLMRERTPRPFRITTNGNLLTPEMVAELEALKPVYLHLSLNSASVGRRATLMRGRRPEVGIDALPLLRNAAIPYAVVIVPWPVDSVEAMLDDLAPTVAYADANDAHLVQVNLPGYTRHFSDERVYDLEEVWSSVVTVVRRLRHDTGAPIVVMPSMYEENLYEETKNLPRVIGVVRNSPAERCGVMKGDELRKVGSIVISSRPQARDILSVIQQGDVRHSRLTVMREGVPVELDIKLDDFSYPYSRETDRHTGIIFMGTGLRPSYLQNLRALTTSRGAREVLLLSSRLVAPTFGQLAAESHLLGDVKLDVLIPENRFFGGNIFMGDLLVVQDFIDCIKAHLCGGGTRPDLVVIPSTPFSLGGWGRDLTGRVYLDIERAVGIPVALLECSPIFD